MEPTTNDSRTILAVVVGIILLGLASLGAYTYLTSVGRAPDTGLVAAFGVALGALGGLLASTRSVNLKALGELAAANSAIQPPAPEPQSDPVPELVAADPLDVIGELDDDEPDDLLPTADPFNFYRQQPGAGSWHPSA